MRNGPRLLPAALLVLALGACDTTRIFRGNPDDASSKESEYVTSPTPLKDTDLESLWDASDNVLRMEGWSIDSERTAYESHEMVTHWESHLAPNRFEGKRKRAVVKFAKAPEGGWNVSVVVQTQRNIDIDNPSNPANANWEDQPADERKAGAILYKIEMGFRDDVAEPR
jgi:hypothetical protein